MLDPTYEEIQEITDKKLKDYLWSITIDILKEENIKISEPFKRFIQKNIDNQISLNDIHHFLSLRKNQEVVKPDYYAINIMKWLENGLNTSFRPLQILTLNVNIFDQFNHQKYNIDNNKKEKQLMTIIDQYEEIKNEKRTFEQKIEYIIEMILACYNLEPFQNYNLITCYLMMVHYLQYNFSNVNYKKLYQETKALLYDILTMDEKHFKKILTTVLEKNSEVQVNNPHL